MCNGIAESVSLDLVGNHIITAPTRRTAGQIGFAIIVSIKQFGQLRIFQLFDISDVVLISGFLINQITLGCACT